MKWRICNNTDERVIRKGKLIVCVPITNGMNNKQIARREELAKHVRDLLNSAAYPPFGPR